MAGIDRTFTKKNVYITNIVKCRPPGNRDPRPEEAESCFPYLEQQVVYIRPKAILTVGRIAAQSLLHTSKGIGTLRESLHRWKDIPLIATYHPSAVLRDPGFKTACLGRFKTIKGFPSWMSIG
jgi:DNA polymerase